MNKPRVLVLDDLGKKAKNEPVKAVSTWVQEKITSLVDYRVRNGGSVIVATNLAKEEMADHMGSPLASRLWSRGEVVHIKRGDFGDRR